MRMNFRRAVVLTMIVLCFTISNLSAQNVLSGPYLIEPGETAITIRWEMNSKSDYKIEWGKSESRTKKETLVFRESKHGGYLYEVNLTGLKPGTAYSYRLLSQNENSWKSFKTFAKGTNKFTFVAMGDSRSNPDIFTKIMDETKKENPDFIISMGDLVEVGGDYDEWHEFYFPIVKDFVSSTPLVSTLGDHETDGDNGDLFRYFLRKNEPVDKQWFSFDYGNAHFISLDFRHPDDQEMIDWFIKDITSAGKEWNIVYSHRATYNFGGHRTDWGSDYWRELFSNYNVDIVFAGHSHLYERFYPVRGKERANAVVYVTTGGAGAGLYQSVKNEDILAVTESVNHFVTVNIDKNKLRFKATRMDGSLLDRFEIVKNKKGYNQAFEAVVIQQEKMNTITGFNTAASRNLTEVPLFVEPAKYHMELHSYYSQDIPFSVELNPESAEYYTIESFKDTLRANEKREVVFNIARTKEIKISEWGVFTPELRIKLIYEYEGNTDTIVGKAINYWPDSPESY